MHCFGKKKNANFLKQAHYMLLNSLLHKKATWLITYYLLILCILGLLWKKVFCSKSLICYQNRKANRITNFQACNVACQQWRMQLPVYPSPHYTYLVLHLQNWQFVSRQVFLWGVLLLFWEATNISFFKFWPC